MRQQEVVGLYKSEQDAQSALDELIAAGFSRGRIAINHETDKGQYTVDSSGRLVRAENYEPPVKHESAMQEFFRALVGKNDEKNRAQAYSHAVSQGHIVLQVAADSDDQASRATQIMDRHNPVDIDDYALSIRDFIAGMNEVPSYMQHGAAPSNEGSNVGKDEQSSGTGTRSGSSANASSSSSVGRVKSYIKGTSSPLKAEGKSSPGMEGMERPPTYEAETIYAGPPEEESGKQLYEGAAHTSDTNDFQRHCQEHWKRSYWTSGGSYDDYEPAYRYGADFADNDTNPNHQWADVEMRLHSDWIAYNRDESSWEQNKEAIRCGWEKGKGHGKGTHSGHSLQ